MHPQATAPFPRIPLRSRGLHPTYLIPGSSAGRSEYPAPFMGPSRATSAPFLHVLKTRERVRALSPGRRLLSPCPSPTSASKEGGGKPRRMAGVQGRAMYTNPAGGVSIPPDAARTAPRNPQVLDSRAKTPAHHRPRGGTGPSIPLLLFAHGNTPRTAQERDRGGKSTPRSWRDPHGGAGH